MLNNVDNIIIKVIMGKTQSKPNVNSGTVINEIKIQQTEVTNIDLIYLIYVIAAVHIMKFFVLIYKLWHRSLKKKYTTNISLDNLDGERK